jgi:trehalose 6-phosphate phosphatase
MRELAPFTTAPERAGVFLDFDGTLSEIVRRPEEASAVRGAREVLERLSGRFAVVAFVTGRPADEVRARLDVEAVHVFGLYGMEEEPASSFDPDVLPAVEAVAATIPGAWVERKAGSLAVHFREAPDPEGAERHLAEALGAIAAEHVLQVLPGKRVLEVTGGRPSKGAVVDRVARGRSLAAVLYAGDDVADLDAFDALDRLGPGVSTLRVAVRGAETPQGLLDRADVVVDGPAGLVGLLERLATA